jgi:uncharacterized protein HemX
MVAVAPGHPRRLFRITNITKTDSTPIEENVMSRLLIVVLLIVVCALGAGFYYGYLHLTSDNTDGTRHITLTVEQKKLQEDEQKAVGRVEGKKEMPKSQ